MTGEKIRLVRKVEKHKNTINSDAQRLNKISKSVDCYLSGKRLQLGSI